MSALLLAAQRITPRVQEVIARREHEATVAGSWFLAAVLVVALLLWLYGRGENRRHWDEIEAEEAELREAEAELEERERVAAMGPPTSYVLRPKWEKRMPV